MATFTVHSQERITNVELLNNIISDSVTKINAIDAALQQLVSGGLKGSAVETMAKTYIDNRKNIGELLQQFSKYSIALKEQEESNTKLDNSASESAVGTPIS